MISYIASNFELVYERNLKVPLYIAMNMEGPGSDRAWNYAYCGPEGWDKDVA